MDNTIEIHDSAVQEMFSMLLDRVSDLTPTMQAIGLFYERSVIENFRNQSAPDGTPWKPLAAETLMMGLAKKKGWKQNGGLSAKGKRYLQGKRILWEHGDLEGSIHSQATANSVTIGTGDHIPYAAIQQLGGQAGRGHKVTIDAREYLALNRGGELELAEKDRTMILGIIRERLFAD
jgi:phage virion morphogenesis protein